MSAIFCSRANDSTPQTAMKGAAPRAAPLIIQIFQMSEAERRTQVFPQFHPVLFGDRQKHFHDLGIELRPGTPAYLFPRMRHRQGLAVWPVADHGIHRVGKGENSRPKRNLLAAPSPRITR